MVLESQLIILTRELFGGAARLRVGALPIVGFRLPIEF
jgi:hypothetical protein